MKNKVFVIGHKNPDTDSICSAIAYANFKNATCTDPETKHTARRAGDVSNETKFVLNHFKVKAPKFLEYVGTQVEDLNISQVPPIHKDMTMKDTWATMQKVKKATMPIVENNKLLGVITVKDIATANMDVFEDRILSISNTTYKHVAETLNGEMIVGEADNEVPSGKILIGSSHVELLETIIEPGDILITGNRFESQFCAIEMNVGCIVVCLDAVVSKTIQKLASEKGVRILKTPYDTYMASRIISQSVPVSYFMCSEKIISFGEEDFVSDIKQTLSNVRHRDFPVLDRKGNYLGMFSRRDLLNTRKKQIIMVDHNEKSQAVDGISEAEVLEIIDHHRLGGLDTTSPVYFRNQPVGCTCTIVYLMYKERNVEIPADIAGLMCSAIISDTLMFRSPTCTPVDATAAQELSKIAGIDIPTYAESMFRAGSDLKGKSNKDLFYQDYKVFNVGDFEFGVGQISSLDTAELEHLKTEMIGFMDSTLDKDDTAFFLLTNILQESSCIVFHGENSGKILENAFGVPVDDHFVNLEGIVSRKKQFVPKIISALE